MLRSPTPLFYLTLVKLSKSKTQTISYYALTDKVRSIGEFAPHPGRPHRKYLVQERLQTSRCPTHLRWFAVRRSTASSLGQTSPTVAIGCLALRTRSAACTQLAWGIGKREPCSGQARAAAPLSLPSSRTPF